MSKTIGVIGARKAKCYICGKDIIVNKLSRTDKITCKECKRKRLDIKKFKCKKCSKLIGKTKLGYCRECVSQSIEYRNNVKKGVRKHIDSGTHKGWISRNITSYPEQFFIKVLKNNNIFTKCTVNYQISKKKLNIEGCGSYFLDFYFSNKMIDLEIDGRQHKDQDRITSDKKRDNALTDYGIKVYRIPWKNINNNKGKKYIKDEIDKFLNFYNNRV